MLQEEKPKGQQVVFDATISKYLEERSEADLQQRRAKKQGIACSKLPCPKVHRFIADAVSMKGNNSYISESVLGLFYGKAEYGYKINVAKEVAHQAQQQMASVVNKGQKMVKCSHIWLGLYKHALSDGKKPVVPVVQLDEEV